MANEGAEELSRLLRASTSSAGDRRLERVGAATLASIPGVFMIGSPAPRLANPGVSARTLVGYDWLLDETSSSRVRPLQGSSHPSALRPGRAALRPGGPPLIACPAAVRHSETSRR